MAIEKQDSVDREQFLTEWAEECGQEFEDRQELLLDPPKFSDLWMKRWLLSHSLKPISAESRGDSVDLSDSKGANMEVYDFVEEDFAQTLEALVGENMEIDDQIRAKIKDFAAYVAKRYVFKVGNVQHFPVNIGGKVMPLSRDHMEREFAPLGYLVKNSWKRAEKLAREVLRLNLFIGREDESPVTGAFLCQEIRRFIEDPKGFFHMNTSGFFLQRDEGEENLRVNTLHLRDNPYSTDFDVEPDYLRLNCKYRDVSEIDRYEDDLKPFCDALVTIGFHDVVRRLTGYNKHTTLSYDQFKELLEDLLQKHSKESFVLSEHTTFGYDPRVRACDWKEMIEDNDEATDLFVDCFEKVLPEKVKGLFADEEVKRTFALRVMEHWHKVPDYEVDPATTVMSTAMLRFVAKAAYLHLLNPDPQKRRDFEKDPMLKKFFETLDEDEESLVSGATLTSLYYYHVNAKVGNCPKFQRYEETHVKVQDRLDYGGENVVVKEGPFSIAKIVNERPDILKDHPEVAEKLMVYFYQIYKYYRYTGYIPDMRPNNVFKYLLGLGEWALQDENTQIVIYENTKTGEVFSKVTNIDPEDQFKRTPRHQDEKDPREGLATYGLNLDIFGGRSFKKAMLRFADQIAAERGVRGEKEKWTLAKSMSQYVLDLFRETAESSSEATDFATRSLVQEMRRQFSNAWQLMKQARPKK
jgi:hypothetical protein